jgi:hypothetical protein
MYDNSGVIDVWRLTGEEVIQTGTSTAMPLEKRWILAERT